jgi:hypothetical protein
MPDAVSRTTDLCSAVSECQLLGKKQFATAQ